MNPGLGSKLNLTMGDFKLVLKSDFTCETWLLGNLELGSAMKMISLDYISCCRHQVNFEMTVFTLHLKLMYLHLYSVFTSEVIKFNTSDSFSLLCVTGTPICVKAAYLIPA